MGGNQSLLSAEYKCVASASCFWLFKQEICCAFALALLKTGKSIEASSAMIAMTTNNSINVNPFALARLTLIFRARFGPHPPAKSSTAVAVGLRYFCFGFFADERLPLAKAARQEPVL